MTPLAHRIVAQLAVPPKERRFTDKGGILGAITEAHCFECSAVSEAVEKDCCQITNAVMAGHDKMAFLPAPVTWIEIEREMLDFDTKERLGRGRLGFLLQQVGDRAIVRAAFENGGVFGSIPGSFTLPLTGSASMSLFSIAEEIAHLMELVEDWIRLIYGYLAFINTPRVVGRREHAPHSGLQRRIAHARGMTGKFPLNAWTEIKLEIMPPKSRSGPGGGTQGERLTGARARHFVRCHLRVKRGQLELVSAHHRGDPALGTKRSRYVLTDRDDDPPVNP